MRGLTIIATISLLACGSEGPVYELQDERFVEAVQIRPTVVSATTGPDGGDPVQFEAYARYTGDSLWYPIQDANWTLSNAGVGTLDETGQLTPGTAGGITWVDVEYGGLSARATVTAQYVDTWMVGDPDVSLFDEGRLPIEDSLRVAWYPSKDTAVPRNTRKMAFLVREPDVDNPPTAWRLHITSDLVDLTVFLDDDGWFPTPEQWDRLTSTNSSADLVWEAVAANPTKLWTDTLGPRNLRIERFDAKGTVYYWSSSVQGVKVAPYGETGTDFLSQNTTGDCIGCHSVSNGGVMAFTYGSWEGFVMDESVRTLGLLDLNTMEWRATHTDLIYATYKTFSPDGTRLLTVSNGQMWINDAQTGERIAPIPTEHPVTQAVWSPDGSEVCVVVVDGDWIDDYRFQGSYLARMADLGDDTFGELEPIWVPEGGTAYYPAYSPDGEWLAFVQSDENVSHLPPDAALYVLPTAGGEPVHLEKASKTYSVNTWPHWAPLPDDDVMWLAFTAQRTYGDLSQDILQIWIAGFDAERARQGEDPSWAAFWWPDQDAGEANHRPFWLE